jgi:prophage tail gpP-like protein
VTVEVRADGKRLTNFQSGTVQLSLGELAGTFEVEYAVSSRQGSGRALVPGEPVEIWVADRMLIGGYVDTIDDEDGESQLRLRAAGRSKAEDLVDSSAEHKSFSNLTIGQIAQQLAAPHGVTVVLEGDMGDKFPRFSVQKGETVADAIQRGAQLRGLYAVPVGADVVLCRPGAGDVVVRLERGVLPLMRTARSDSWYSRFSHYVFKGQVPSSDQAWGPKAAQLKTAVTDEQITRYRPQLLHVAGHGVGDLTTRATVVRNQRAGQGQTVTLTCAGLTAPGDVGPWRPNLTVSVKNEPLGLGGDVPLLVAQVRMQFGVEAPEQTELALTPPSAFDVGKYKALHGRSKWWRA